MTTVELPKRITVRWLVHMGACKDGWQATFRKVFPNGALLTREAAYKGQEAELDVVWAGVKALQIAAPERIKDFRVFILRQRQPHLVSRFRVAGLPKQAEAIIAIDWSDLAGAKQILKAATDAAITAIVANAANASIAANAASYARDAIYAAAVREQIDWLCDALGLPEKEDQP